LKTQKFYELVDIQEKATFYFLIGMVNIKHHGAERCVYLSVLS